MAATVIMLANIEVEVIYTSQSEAASSRETMEVKGKCHISPVLEKENCQLQFLYPDKLSLWKQRHSQGKEHKRNIVLADYP